MVVSSENKELVFKFLQDQIALTDSKIKTYVYTNDELRNQRHVYPKLSKYVSDYLNNNDAPRWLIVTGLRGSGKTTLLAQLCNEYKESKIDTMFISVDSMVQLAGITLQEMFEVYEEFYGSFNTRRIPLLFFLDEAQYDEKWGITIRTIYNRTNKVSFVITGSSSLILNHNPDDARRSVKILLSPLTFTEFAMIGYKKRPQKGLMQNMRDAFLSSQSAKEVYEKVILLENTIKTYWLDLAKNNKNNKNLIEEYLRIGSLPFMLNSSDEMLVYNQTKETLEKVVSFDIPKVGSFDHGIVEKAFHALYLIAETDQLTLTKLANHLNISPPTLGSLMDTFVKTGILTRVYPYGSHHTQAKNKPSKYLFNASAHRAMFFHLASSIRQRSDYIGKLLEDVVCMYFMKQVNKMLGSSLTYDSGEGGADFILSAGEKRIVIEVGIGKKEFKQVKKTAKKINANYSVIIADDKLTLAEEYNAVRIPLEYFFVM